MSNYLNSDKVGVAFPNNKRNTNTSRNMTELAFTRVTTNIVDVPGWVISDALDTSAGAKFKFCIKGYYFEVDAVALHTLITSAALGSPSNVYAVIEFLNEELVGQNNAENPSKYTGLDFKDQADSSGTKVSLLILQKVNGAYIVPEASKKKFNRIEIYIDGGLQ